MRPSSAPGSPSFGRALGRTALVGALSGALLGCTVERPGPTDRPFPCAADADCLAGFDCVDGSPLGRPGFCAPSCDPSRSEETCPEGVCTPDGACIARCAIDRDGTVRRACPSELTCIRSDLFRDEGLCYAWTGCTVGSECAGEPSPSTCLADVLGIPTLVAMLPIASNRLYCIDTPTGPTLDRCPEGTIPIPERPGFAGACLPTCNADLDTCPPGLSCWRGLGWIFGAPQQSVCWVGSWGAPCESDTECLLGRCLSVGGGRRVCTESCDDVPVLGGGCGALRIVADGAPGAIEWTCQSVDGDEVCVPEGGIGAFCGLGRACIGALRCFGPREEATGFCTRGCRTDEECYLAEIPEPRRGRAYCDQETQLCEAQRGGGASCREDRECLSGRCAATVCTNPGPL